MKNERLYAFLAGGDWHDASVSHVVVPEDVNLDQAKKDWRAYYNDEYWPAQKRNERPRPITFVEWLIERCGARYPTEDELIEVHL